MTASNGAKEILLVEDNQAQSALIALLFAERSTPHRLLRVADGAEALDVLYHRNHYATAPRPDLVLLDLNLPKVSGREVLMEIRGNAVFSRIPVLILTTSVSERDVDDCYDLKANAFLTKPDTLAEFSELIASIDAFWLQHATLPTARSA